MDSLPGEMASAYCGVVGPCCREAGRSFDAGTCRLVFEGLFRQEFSEARPENYAYDANAAASCVAEVRASAGQCVLETGVGSGAGCDAAFSGKLAPGASCRSGIECARPDAGDSDCDEVNGRRVCVHERRGVEGDACEWTCTESGGSRSCAGRGSSGDEAPIRTHCFTNDGLHCSDEGRCAVQGAEGDPCSGDDDGCEPGLHCDGTACAPRIAAGGECRYDGCVDGHFCKEGVCDPQKAAGASCTEFDECLEGYCESGTCSEGGGLGDLGVGLLCGLAGG